MKRNYEANAINVENLIYVTLTLRSSSIYIV